MAAFDQSKETMFDWVECFGGPADGETIPVDPTDPLSAFPYQTLDESVHWYHLRQNADGTLRFFLKGYIDHPDWIAIPDHDAPTE